MPATFTVSLPVRAGTRLFTIPTKLTGASWALLHTNDPTMTWFAVDGDGNVTLTNTGADALIAGKYELAFRPMPTGVRVDLVVDSVIQPPETSEDGSSNAPSGLAQMPRLLSPYSVRPEWKVAGVDYAVGIPSGRALMGWQQLNISGVTVDVAKHCVTVAANNVKLDGVDFTSNGGAYVNLSAASGVSILNSRFGGVNLQRISAGVINTDVSSAQLTVKYCEIDGSGSGTGATLLFIRGGGTTTMMYNYLYNFPQHVVEFVDTLGDVVYKYNLISQGGQQTGAHLNHCQLGAGQGTLDIGYNTFVQEGAQPASGEGVQCYFNSGGKLLRARLYNNTCIARGGEAGTVMSYMLHGGSTLDGSVDDNWFDASGSWGALYPNSFPGWALINNLSLLDGKPIA